MGASLGGGDISLTNYSSFEASDMRKVRGGFVGEEDDFSHDRKMISRTTRR